MEHKDMSGTEEVNQGEPYINLFEKKYGTFEEYFRQTHPREYRIQKAFESVVPGRPQQSEDARRVLKWDADLRSLKEEFLSPEMKLIKRMPPLTEETKVTDSSQAKRLMLLFSRMSVFLLRERLVALITKDVKSPELLLKLEIDGYIPGSKISKELEAKLDFAAPQSNDLLTLLEFGLPEAERYLESYITSHEKRPDQASSPQ